MKEKFSDFKPFTSDFKPAGADFKIYAGLYYHSNNLWNPEVGDYRVQFSYAGRHGEEFTVIGRQSGREIRPYQTQAGEELLILRSGVRDVGDMFRSEHHVNRTTTWIYRLAGWFLAFLGLSCMSSMLDIFLNKYPILRRAVSLSVASVHFSVSISLTLLIIGKYKPIECKTYNFHIPGISWLFYRPGLALLLLCIGVVPHAVPLIQLWRRNSLRQSQTLGRP